MRRISSGSLLATAALALLLGACASSDVGDIYPGPNGRAVSEVKGIVRSVDTRNDCVIQLDNATSTDYRLNNGYGNANGGPSTVYCDRNTRVVFQGKTYRPEDLERGDEIIADVGDVGGRLVADRIDVTYDASSQNRAGTNDRYGRGGYGGGPYDNGRNGDGRYGDSGRYGNNGSYGGQDRYGYGNSSDPYGGNHDLRGTVRSVDPQGRMLTLERVDYYSRSLDRGNGDLLTLYYDAQTRVSFRGQSYRPENLEPGDVVAINVDDVRGTLVANQVDVVSDVRGNSAQYPPR